LTPTTNFNSTTAMLSVLCLSPEIAIYQRAWLHSVLETGGLWQFQLLQGTGLWSLG